jgi:gamma-glutamyltranspeptidase/glutathione hydrolase
VAGLLTALDRYGTLDRHAALSGAIRLARNGFQVGSRLAHSMEESGPEMIKDRGAAGIFFSNGRTYREGEIWKQPDLAETLETIRDQGLPGFYGGEVAELISLTMQHKGGIITKEDLSGYRAFEREPLRGSYRGHSILTAPPPSAGGTILLQMLNILEHFDVSRYKRGDPGVLHLIAASAQCAFADRSAYAADPSVVSIPTDSLVSKSYSLRRLGHIDPERATPGDRIKPGSVVGEPGQETTHYCVIDGAGNAVSATVSLNDAYGAKVAVEGAGFLLNNTMDDFVIKAGEPNLYGLTSGDWNTIAPGRRMVSSMCPTIVLRNGTPYLLLGARGGSRIPTTLVQVIVNVIDFRLGLEDAVNSGRVHHQWIPEILYYEKGGLETATIAGLKKLGYRVEILPSSPGRVQSLQNSNGSFTGVPDPREGGAALGF